MTIWMRNLERKDMLTVQLFAKIIQAAGFKIRQLNWKQFTQPRKKDIIHLHWFAPFYQSKSKCKLFAKSFSFFMVLLFWRTRGIKIVWSVHNAYPHDMYFPFTEKIIRILIIRFFSKLFLFSPANQAGISSEFMVKSDKIKIIPFGSHKGLLKEHKLYNIRERFTFPTIDEIYLFFGKIKPYKGLEKLIRAFTNSNNNLLISGKCSDKNYLNRIKKMITTPNIILDVRFIPNDEIFTLFSSVEAVIIPYEQITFSGVMMLCIAFNKIIITPDKGDISYYIKDGINGILLKENNTDEIILSMKKAESINKEKLISYNNYLSDSLLNWDKIGRKLKREYLLLNEHNKTEYK